MLTLASLFPDASRPVFGVFVERQTIELAARADVDLTVIAPLGIPPWPLARHARYRALSTLPHQQQWHGLTVHRPRFPIIPGGNGLSSAALMSRAVLPLVRRLHAEKPFDVIDAEFFFPDGPAAMRIARALDLPLSIKARGADIHYWGRQRWTANEVREAGLAADGLLAVSQAMKRDMIAIGLPGDHIRVHYTGVDLDRFKPGDRAALKAAMGFEGHLIASVGALIPRKGQGLLIEALVGLPNATLALAGQGPHRGALETLAREHRVAGRVHFLGNLPHETLPDLFAAADVMALPSESEGLANAWVEALACGTPIVISDVGGAQELMDRPEAGRIVPRTPLAVAGAIAQILTHPPDPFAVRKAAERFTWAENTRLLFDHLSGIKRH
ncbi:glycosyltransferase involved in cell wall biosynthesis [Sphingobium boeckii]|uniref:Glycosyltransferase involved in cell wall biosynthesis n=1 Tax=Sphingobium boeckii TaxID=1082345 RepID=A0A7W9AIP2_9SPHN|nr:glycosyltransferase involved in cell wall biosynthesis [Sphingobium boeckii]